MTERQRAASQIAVNTYEPTTCDQPADAPVLVEIHVTAGFSGDITGTGTVRFLQTLSADGSASFCGIERVVGSVAGRNGSFLLQDAGTVSGSVVTGGWFVVPNSASGELTGLRGEGGFEAELGQNARWFE
jgi:hypothetical protein